ncbi:MAG: hypothetical protein U0R52_06000 [Solirubrobacterales bacterium]
MGELRSRQEELRSLERAAQARSPLQGELIEIEQRIGSAERGFDRWSAERQDLESQSRWRRPRGELERVAANEAREAGVLRALYPERDRLAAEIARFEMQRPSGLDPAERLEQGLIAERLGQLLRRELAAERLQPSSFVREALGERPTDPRLLEAWNEGAQEIHSYRQAHGVGDPRRALGREPESGFEAAAWQKSAERLGELQRRLGVSRELERSLERGIGLEL